MSADHNDSDVVKGLGYLAVAIVAGIAAFVLYF